MALAIQHNVPLKCYNTLALDGVAEHFVVAKTLVEIDQAIATAQQQDWPVTVLGGGSNVVVCDRISGLTIKVELTGIERLSTQDSDIEIRVGAGENWHQLVMTTLQNGWYGLENLSLIPGTVGAAPVQNIGAYGVELSDYLSAVEWVDTTTGEHKVLSTEQCQFGYRHSIFKGELQGKALITAVVLKLSSKPCLRIDYPSLKEQLGQGPYDQLTPQQVSEAVCKIRSSKLPDPAQIPNVGSFFKNPIVSSEQARSLRETFPNLVVFPTSQPGQLKLAAGWLIEQAGWKGRVVGEVGVHNKQALVLVNHGSATGAELLALSSEIVRSVQAKFGVELQMEPRILC